MYSKYQIFNLLIFLLLISCSSLVENTRKSLLGDDKPRSQATQAQEVKWVSKAQYDDLMNKYKDLNERYEKVKLQNGSGELEQLSQNNPSTETVDVFGKNGIVKEEPAAATPPVVPASKMQNNTSIGEDLDYFKKAVALKENEKLDEALKIFQYLENSKSLQISVRAKRHIGDIYFSKSQFDLALQVYEDVIRKNAFSGATLNALGKAALCAESLGLMDKKAQYESLLKDVFGIQV